MVQNEWFLWNQVVTIVILIQQMLCIEQILDYANADTKLWFKNTPFNEFLIISNKNNGFLNRFYIGFSEQYHTFELQILFVSFESLKAIEFLMHAVV